MEPRDEQQGGHLDGQLGGQPDEPGVDGRRFAAAVEPVDVDGVRAVAVGAALWLVALVALLPFTSRLADTGRAWWLFTCLAGVGLGLVGLEYCRRRRPARVEDEDADPA